MTHYLCFSSFTSMLFSRCGEILTSWIQSVAGSSSPPVCLPSCPLKGWLSTCLSKCATSVSFVAHLCSFEHVCSNDSTVIESFLLLLKVCVRLWPRGLQLCLSAPSASGFAAAQCRAGVCPDLPTLSTGVDSQSQEGSNCSALTLLWWWESKQKRMIAEVIFNSLNSYGKNSWMKWSNVSCEFTEFCASCPLLVNSPCYFSPLTSLHSDTI